MGLIRHRTLWPSPVNCGYPAHSAYFSESRAPGSETAALAARHQIPPAPLRAASRLLGHLESYRIQPLPTPGLSPWSKSCELWGLNVFYICQLVRSPMFRDPTLFSSSQTSDPACSSEGSIRIIGTVVPAYKPQFCWTPCGEQANNRSTWIMNPRWPVSLNPAPF